MTSRGPFQFQPKPCEIEQSGSSSPPYNSVQGMGYGHVNNYNPMVWPNYLGDSLVELETF